ncbi:MAG: Phage tail fiber protein [Clostridium sp.]
MADSCYINQTNSKWKNLSLGSSTVGNVGCIVCCAAMVICKKLAISDDDGKLKVIKGVISNCTNNNGDFKWNSSITYNDTTFTFTRTTTKPDYNAWPIVFYRSYGHAVLATSPSTVLDPGKSSITTVDEANNRYKSSDMAYWTHTPSVGDSSFTCDTHSTVTIQRGNKYQARITCSQYPKVVAGTGGIVSTSLASQSGNDYYFTFTGVNVGSTGIYINNSTSPVFICKVV